MSESWMESMSDSSRFKSGSRIGVTASMRRYRFRRIQSGEPRKSFGFPPLPKYHTRACSRNVSTMRVTRMLRLYFRPGMRQQIPRTIRSILTPACEASYRRSIMAGSCKAFILSIILPCFPLFASSISWSMRRFSSGIRLKRATSRRWNTGFSLP